MDDCQMVVNKNVVNQAVVNQDVINQVVVKEMVVVNITEVVICRKESRIRCTEKLTNKKKENDKITDEGR